MSRELRARLRQKRRRTCMQVHTATPVCVCGLLHVHFHRIRIVVHVDASPSNVPYSRPLNGGHLRRTAHNPPTPPTLREVATSTHTFPPQNKKKKTCTEKQTQKKHTHMRIAQSQSTQHTLTLSTHSLQNATYLPPLLASRARARPASARSAPAQARQICPGRSRTAAAAGRYPRSPPPPPSPAPGLRRQLRTPCSGGGSGRP